MCNCKKKSTGQSIRQRLFDRGSRNPDIRPPKQTLSEEEITAMQAQQTSPAEEQAPKEEDAV